MTAKQAREVADEFIVSELGCELPFIDVHKSERISGEWNVLYQSVNDAGKVFEGPVVVVVDEKTGKARLFESL